MKNLYFAIITFTAFTCGINTQVFAQKQSRIEKLYQYIDWKEYDKYDRLRERIDSFSMAAYKNEILLADALKELLQFSRPDAIEPYLKNNMIIQQQDEGERLRFFCQTANLTPATFYAKADSTILALLIKSSDQQQVARMILSQIKEFQYLMDPDTYEAILLLKEKSQFADLQATPTLEACSIYFKEYPNQHHYADVATIYNRLLYDMAARETKNDSALLRYFNDTTLKAFYTNSKQTRPYWEEARKLYDNKLYHALKTATTPDIRKRNITTYLQCPYLNTGNRLHLQEVEFLNDSIDLNLLASRIDSLKDLPLIKNYLQTHKYKIFKDKALHLKNRFIDSITYTSPTVTRCYSKTNLIRETKVHNDSLTVTNYRYNKQGFLTQIVQRTTWFKDSLSSKALKLIVTTYKYNPSGQCYEEQIRDSLHGKIMCQISYQYDTTAFPVMKNTQWTSEENSIDYYNSQGQITQTKEYRGGQICAQADYTYDQNGNLSCKTWVNLRPDTDHPETRQVTRYTYNPFGYLVEVFYTKENLENEKITSNTTLTYDEFGNLINPNYQYIYDQTGAWTHKPSKTNPTEREQITYTYKLGLP